MSASRRQSMVQHGHVTLCVVRQCDLLGISRSGWYYTAKGEPAMNQIFMREIDLAFTSWPFLGVCQMRSYLRLLGYSVGIKRVRRLTRLMGLILICQKPKTTIPHLEHRRHPYLLRGLAIIGLKQVWCSDITYIPMRKGFLYLVAIMDWHSRRVLSWRLSNSMNTDFCVAARDEALANTATSCPINWDHLRAWQITPLCTERDCLSLKVASMKTKWHY